LPLLYFSFNNSLQLNQPPWLKALRSKQDINWLQRTILLRLTSSYVLLPANPSFFPCSNLCTDTTLPRSGVSVLGIYPLWPSFPLLLCIAACFVCMFYSSQGCGKWQLFSLPSCTPDIIKLPLRCSFDSPSIYFIVIEKLWRLLWPLMELMMCFLSKQFASLF
jgi:hypothetical protein